MLKSTKPGKCLHCRVRLTDAESSECRTIHLACVTPWVVIRKAKEVAAWAKKRAKAAKVERASVKVRREKDKRRPEWLKEAQTAFNAFIRARDADLPCVSCGRHHQGQYHAGHYLTTGARPELRFSVINCWKQCSPCNLHLHGNLILYRVELIRRIGLDSVEWLEGPHEPTKYTIDDLRAIKKDYTAALKVLKAAA